jgi:UDP-N-acetylmuramoyl-tripeptide--D-alanyl-D-alanine ligase
MDITALYNVFRANPQVCTDTRKLRVGDIFFALKGENFDGNTYAEQALEKGAAYAVVDDNQYLGKPKMILVNDVLNTLQQLANHHRRQFNIPLIAITGSNGKTTTKELVSSVLAAQYPTHFTRGNFNNHIGVPLTLLAMPLDSEVAVIEMGANHQGEIDFLCKIAEPTHGLITNIGHAHLEGFGGLEGVKKGKSELYRHLAASNGLAFINRDELFLEDLAEPVQKKLFYQKVEELSGLSSYFDIQLIEEKPFVKAAFLSEDQERIEINSQLIGLYNFNNIMTAIALGKYFKVPASKIKMVIEGYQPNNNRSQWLKKDSNTFLLDAYNANPSSMLAAVSYFATVQAEKKIVILGDMLELGADSEALHQQLIDQALAAGFTDCIFVGPIFSAIAQANNLRHFLNVQELKQWFDQEHLTDTYFLIKGSRGIRLEKLLE